jgi:hypothetical protein
MGAGTVQPIHELVDVESLASSIAPFDRDAFIGEMVEETCKRYRAAVGQSVELVEFDDGTGYRFVFDHAGANEPALHEPRVVAGWGSARAHPGPRDANRMRGFPMLERLRGDHDRGHLFSHAAGGGTDVNLFVQARGLNRGWSPAGRRWRELERLAARRLDAVLMVSLIYDGPTAVPAAIQAVLVGDAGIVRADQLSNR